MLSWRWIAPVVIALAIVFAVNLSTPKPAEAAIHEIVASHCSFGHRGNVDPPGQIRFGEQSFLRALFATGVYTDVIFGEDPDGSEGREQDAGKSGRVGGERSERLEYLRFDCFNEDPHYHYISWKHRSNEMLHLDPVADGDPLLWALERIRTRLPQMLERAGARELAARVDPRLVEQVLPRVSEAAWRSRYHHDDEAVSRDALKRKAR